MGHNQSEEHFIEIFFLLTISMWLFMFSVVRALLKAILRELQVMGVNADTLILISMVEKPTYGCNVNFMVNGSEQQNSIN